MRETHFVPLLVNDLAVLHTGIEEFARPDEFFTIVSVDENWSQDVLVESGKVRLTVGFLASSLRVLTLLFEASLLVDQLLLQVVEMSVAH